MMGIKAINDPINFNPIGALENHTTPNAGKPNTKVIPNMNCSVKFIATTST